MDNYVFISILLPFICGLIVLATPKAVWWIKNIFVFLAVLVNLLIAFFLFGKDINIVLPWAGLGIDLSFRLYHFSAFILAAAACFALLIVLYSFAFMRNKSNFNQFFAYLLVTLSFVNGAVLADNLVVMLFFWEGLLVTLFGMIYIGSRQAFKTAIKAFIIAGVCDLCMMIGIALTAYLSGTLAISKISLSLTPLACVAFTFLMIGAISKAGSMPFHSWIPNAATDAPLPFMAFLPAALEKLLGIYFLTRIAMDMFKLFPGSWISTMLMVIGSATILFAVMMALVQKDYKRLLSYHAISQVGYMVLGIGTAIPIGIVGGVFHMINHAMYKSCLFLTGGAVEKQAGTTDLAKLGGLGKFMPVTFICFIIAAASISGVPPFNGFFSKELVYDAALQRGFVFYFAAIAGSFLTAISFLKLGHAAFVGKKSGDSLKVKEAPTAMLIPMITLSSLCVLFGLWNALPLNHLIQPILGERLHGHSYSGFHINPFLVGMTALALVSAFIYHFVASKKKGSALKASDYIHNAPVLSWIYKRAEAGVLDPYNIGLGITGISSKILWLFDRTVDFISDKLAVGAVFFTVNRLRRLHTGNYVMYLGWSLLGMTGILLFLVYNMK